MADLPTSVRAQRLAVPRGQAITIPLDVEAGSPGALIFTLARTRNPATKLLTLEPQAGSPAFFVELSAEDTNREPCTYWWDVWDTETNRLLAMGSLTIQAVVRLP